MQTPRFAAGLALLLALSGLDTIAQPRGARATSRGGQIEVMAQTPQTQIKAIDQAIALRFSS